MKSLCTSIKGVKDLAERHRAEQQVEKVVTVDDMIVKEKNFRA